MMTSFDQIHQEAKAKGKKRVVVAPVPAEMDFTALSKAQGEGLVTPIVIGSSYAVSPWVKGLGKKASEIEIIEEPDAARALAIAIGMLKKGEADILMRGSLDPNRFLQTVLDKEKGLLKERVASLVSVFDPPAVDQVTMATDTYINSFPSITEKVTITENVIRLAGVLGFASPKIAALSAIEQVNPAIPSTMDAAIWLGQPNAGFYCTPFDIGQKKPVVKTGQRRSSTPGQTRTVNQQLKRLLLYH